MTEHIQVLCHATCHKNQHFPTVTLKLGWQNAPYRSRTYAAIRWGRGILSWQTERSNPGTSNSNTRCICDESLRAQQYIVLRRSHGQVTKVPGQAPHFTECSAESRIRTPLARVKARAHEKRFSSCRQTMVQEDASQCSHQKQNEAV